MQPLEICSRTTASEKLRPQIQQSNAMEVQAQAETLNPALAEALAEDQTPEIEASEYA